MRELDESDIMMGTEHKYEIRNCPHCKQQVRFHVQDDNYKDDMIAQYKDMAEKFRRDCGKLATENKKLWSEIKSLQMLSPKKRTPK